MKILPLLFLLVPLVSYGFSGEDVVKTVNKDRVECNLQILQEDPALNVAAQARAEFLYKQNQWSHDGWHDSFASTSYVNYGENLAKDYKHVKKVNKAWMNSPTHKANILNANYQYTGVGIYKNYVVQLFGGTR